MAPPDAAPKKPGLTGNALLDELARAKDVRALEILWRANEPPLCVRLVPRMTSTGDPQLGTLLLDEFLKPTLGEEVRRAIFQATATGSPPILNQDDTDRLIRSLRVQKAPAGQFPQGRESGERWALAQDGAEADRFTLDLAADDIPSTRVDAIRQRALTRAGRSDLADEAANRILVRLEAQHGPADWQRAIGFLEWMLPEVTSPAITALVESVIDRAPDMTQGNFPTKVRERIATSPQRVQGRLARGDARPGVQALVSIVEAVKDPAERGRLTATVLLRQPTMAQHLDPGRGWSEEEWRSRLQGLIDADRAKGTQALVAFLGRAPLANAPLVMRAAARHGAPDDAALRDVAVTRVRARMQELSANGHSADVVHALDWPTEASDYLAALARVVLKDAVAANQRGLLVGDAVAEDALPAEVAPGLLEPAQFGDILFAPSLAGDRLRAVATSLYDAAPDHMHNVIRKRQTERFSMDLARAIASRSPAAAFAGGAKAYATLSEVDRDELQGLVTAHGDWKQEDLLAEFANDGSKKARGRRIRAVEMAGRVAPKHGAAPAFVVAALGTSRLDLLGPTFAAIASLEPRDVALAHGLRDVAESDGAIGRSEALGTLDALTAAYIEQLSNAGSDEERCLLLELLGATSRPASINVLLDHLGGDAEYDHPPVKRAAAEALYDAVGALRIGAGRFDPQQVQRLGDLIDGPLPEGDPTARARITDVLAVASLGEDGAFSVLYGLIGRTPSGTPDQLVGREKPRLVRAIGHYASSDSMGEAGWPGVIQQLDIMAMCIVRAGYVVAGDNEGTKALIRSDLNKPDYGVLLRQLTGVFTKAAGPLLTLHQARNDETDFTHPGSTPTTDTMMTARNCFKTGANVVIGVIETALRSQGPGTP